MSNWSAKQMNRPVQVLTWLNDEDDTTKLHFDVDSLASILLGDAIRDAPVVMLSVAGDLTKCKTSFLNHCLHYLQSHCANPNALSIGSRLPRDGSLKNLSWCSRLAPNTVGISLWPEPFVITTKNGPVAVLLMDTQTCFDNEHDNSTTALALSTMLSSVQLLNLMHNLEKKHLHMLDIFCDYGQLALEKMHSKPLQRFIFLIRDWPYPHNYPYGFTGGSRLLNAVFQTDAEMTEPLTRVRQRIEHCFQELDCFLMPREGTYEPSNADLKLQSFVQQRNKAFSECLEELVSTSLLNSEHLIVKQIGGQQVTGRELLEHFKAYSAIFQQGIPESTVILEATTSVSILTAVTVALDRYQCALQSRCGPNQPYICPQVLAEYNHKVELNCKEQFDSVANAGGEEFSAPHRARLTTAMAALFERYSLLNSRKSTFSRLGVPLTLLSSVLFIVLLASFLEKHSMLELANAVHILGNLYVSIVFQYFFVRYTGDYPGFVCAVERIIEVAWNWIINFIEIISRQT